MKLSEIDERTQERLDRICGGVFTNIKDCIANDCEIHLSVQTSIEGLKDDQMKLFILVTDGAGDTSAYAIAKLKGSAQILGWNLYLTDLMASARSHVSRAQNTIRKMDALDRS